MDALFVFGDKVAEDSEGRLYTGTSFSQEIFDRYLEHFDHMVLLMRKAYVDPDDTETLRKMNLLTDDRIRIVFLPDTLASLRGFADLKSRKKVRNILEKHITAGYAVILRMHSYYSYVAARICVREKIPFMAEAVGCPWDSLTHHSLKGKLLAPSAFMQMRYCMRHASYALYVTKHFLQDRYPTQGISVAVSDVELLPPDRGILEKRLEKIDSLKNKPDRKLRIGTSGSVQVAYKGQRFVFYALARLKEKGICRYEYHLAGDGNNEVLKTLAKKLGIEDIIFFDGMMPHSQIYSWLDQLDLYIQPSEQEGLSRALAEAMSRALPCFASDTGGNPELLAPSCIHKCGAVREIEKELEDLTPRVMKEMAEYNFMTSMDYQKDVLQKKRSDFMSLFARDAASGSGRKKRQ